MSSYQYLDNIYSDINCSYGENGKPAVISGVDSINQSLTTIFMTPIYSLYRRPQVGTKLFMFIHELLTKNKIEDIKDAVFEASKQETRITTQRRAIKVDRLDETTIKISFPYYIPRINMEASFSETFTVLGDN